MPIVDQSKAKQVRAKVTRGPARQFKAAKRALPEVASIYGDGQEDGSDEEGQHKSKKTRISMGRGINNFDEAEARRSAPVVQEIIDHDPIPRRSLPKNFYSVINPLFDEFWNMEFDNNEVTLAFFAVITNMNCHEFKLTSFAEKSYSLEIIKVCLAYF